METKTIKTLIPEGYEIDKENSTFENIVLKPIEKKRWRDDENQTIKGFWIGHSSHIIPYFSERKDTNRPNNYNVFATEKQAKSALAMARISQIMANDERFGGVVTDEEWKNPNIIKYAIDRKLNRIYEALYSTFWTFLSFHTPEQRDLFLKENEDLVKDYLMID